MLACTLAESLLTKWKVCSVLGDHSSKNGHFIQQARVCGRTQLSQKPELIWSTGSCWTASDKETTLNQPASPNFSGFHVRCPDWKERKCRTSIT